MKKVLLSAVAAYTLVAGSALAADLPAKAKPIAAPPPPAWDVAFGAAIASDYIFRGITQSAHKPSASAYFELRYNVNPDWQFYAGTAGASIDLPNQAAAEIDFYGGVRPTFGKLALDLGPSTTITRVDAALTHSRPAAAGSALPSQVRSPAVCRSTAT